MENQNRKDRIKALRNLFLDKFKEEYNSSPDLFHPYDLERVKHDDKWVERFLLHQENDPNLALNMMWDTCEWRKANNVNEIDENNVNLDYIKEGGCFPYGFDKDGKAMLVFKCKTHVKGSKDYDDMKRCLIYWYERLERQYSGEQITIFFDMSDTGLSNLDMEYTKYLINLNKHYYPNFLNHILVFEMPWVLNAAFKIIKSWLPVRAVQKIKFINKSTIKEYVDLKYILSCWGGEEEFAFVFTPEVRIEVPEFSNTLTFSKMDENKKKVQFVGLNNSSNNSPASMSSFRDVKTDENSVNSTSLLNVIHPDTVYFNCLDGDYVGLVNIENISNRPVIYKLKTTSPERFRVRPSTGIIQPGVSTKVTITVQSGYPVHSIVKDKFLVMSMVAEKEDITSQEISDIWKQKEGVRVEQHRLKCTVIEPVTHTGNNSTESGSGTDDLMNKMDQLKSMVNQVRDFNQKLHKDVTYKQNLLLFAIFFLMLALFILSYLVLRSSTSIPKTSALLEPACIGTIGQVKKS